MAEARVKPQIGGRAVVPKDRLAYVCRTTKERFHRSELFVGFGNDWSSPLFPLRFKETLVTSPRVGEFNIDPLISSLTTNL